MAQFRLRAIRSFDLDGQRYEVGDVLGLDALCVARDLVWRGLAVAVPVQINGTSPDVESAVQH